MLALCLMLSLAHYANNYASIIDSGLFGSGPCTVQMIPDQTSLGKLGPIMPA